MQEHEYKARDKTVQKMSRDGLREENLRSKKERRITGREADEKKTAGHRNRNWILERREKLILQKNRLRKEQGENTDYSPDTLFWNRKKLRKRMKWKAQK